MTFTPTPRRTIAPRGRMPILRSWDRHDRNTAINAITVTAKLRRLGLAPMTILWDKGNVHDRSKALRAYLAGRPSIETVLFPSYTPEANPDECVWQHT